MVDETEVKLAQMEKKIDSLQKENKKLKELLNKDEVNDEYKDRLFKFIFGNPENKQWTLDLYNAVNGTNYTNPNEIQFNTIESFLYMKMKNDVSFIIAFQLNLWEHQSTFNPNMPMRFFRYALHLYEKYIATTDYYEFSSDLQPIPTPKCVCFYNGTKDQPERKIQRLSDAYEGEGDIEVKVTMLNVNYGKNEQLMDACKPLREYAWFVDAVRRNQVEKMDLDAAIDAVVDEMPEGFVIHDFIVANRAEVKTMLFTEYNEEKVMEKQWLDGARIANALTNWLWLNGRGDEAQRIGQDQDLYNRLFDEYSRAQMVTQ